MDISSDKNLKKSDEQGAIPGLDENKSVMIAYTNYRGEAAVRQILPKKIYFGSNQWHSDPQWILVAYDLDKKADRHFAMADIHSWQ